MCAIIFIRVLDKVFKRENINKIAPEISKNTSNTPNTSIETPIVATPIYIPPRVIVVDDSVVCRKSAKKLLERIGYVVYEAKNGADCIIKMREHELKKQIKLIIMDDDMPILDGRKTAFLLRQEGYTKIIIGLTGEHRTDEHKKYIDSGADFVLTKPLDIKLLELYLLPTVNWKNSQHYRAT